METASHSSSGRGEQARGVTAPALQVLAVALAYLITGRLGLLLAIPPGYATAVWLPSGIALAAVLLGGRRLAPGVWLGSFLTNATAMTGNGDGAQSLVRTLAIAATVGVGAALQALAGHALILRSVGFPTSLLRARDIAAFLSLGGPVSCLVNATLGITTLWLAGAVRGEAVPLNWFTWWVGDSIGVFIVAPLAMIWLARPREVWQPRNLSVALPLVITFLLAVAAFVLASGIEQTAMQARFDRRCNDLASALAEDFSRHLEVLHAIRSFQGAAGPFDRERFRQFAAPALARHPDMRGVTWNARVPHERRAEYEEAARNDGFEGFRFTELDSDGRLVTARDRPEYCVIYFVEPRIANDEALGLDSMADPARRLALERARDLGIAVATPTLKLVQSMPGDSGFVVFLPVYRRGAPTATVGERRRSLEGFAVGVFEHSTLIRNAMGNLTKEGIQLHLRDETTSLEGTMLYCSSQDAGRVAGSAHPHGVASRSGMQSFVRLELLGQRWNLQFTRPEWYLVAHRSWLSWAVLVAGLLFTSLLGGFLLALTGQTARTEAVVKYRTDQLAAKADELMAAQRMAEQASRSKSEFLANMSHEIRTPLNAVIGLSGLLADSRLGSRQQEQVSLIRQSAKDLMGIISGILDFSRIEAGKLQIEPVRFPLRTLTWQVAETIAASAVEKELRVVYRYAQDNPWLVEADQGRIRQVLLNLMTNAVKFTPAGRVTLRVTSRRTGDTRALVSFAVQDTGIGIPEEKLPLLFGKFTQIDASTRRHHGGTGLGLAISRGLAELMGGNVEVSSVPGHGSIFTLNLPLEVIEWPEMRKLRQPELEGIPALVIEADPEEREALEEQITVLGAQVRTVATAREALEELARREADGNPYRVVVVGAEGDRLEGHDVGRILGRSEAGRKAALVRLATWMEPLDEACLVEAGFTTWLVQPVRPSVLARALVRAVTGGQTAGGAESAAEPRRPSPRMALQGIRVLVVEDNPTNQRVAAHMLEELGCDVELASDGGMAIRMARNAAYDLVFMDCHMPGMDGYEAASVLRSQAGRSPGGTDGRVPIVALTADASKQSEDRVIASGMDGWLLKPVELLDLEHAIRRWVLGIRTSSGPRRAASRQVLGIAAGDMTEGHVIDPRRWQALFGDGGDRRLAALADLEAGFRSRHAVILERMRVPDSANGELRSLAHELKGMSANLGASRVAAAARRLEEALIAGEVEHRDAWTRTLERECASFLRELRGRIESLRGDQRL